MRNRHYALKPHRRRLSMLASAIWLCSGAGPAAAEHPDAAMNYRMHCEGCHKDDGVGQDGYIPALRGNVSRFLSTPDGRAYLARVPGTAQSLLSDLERAEVLNWIVRTFDPDHLPADFVPYTAEEVGRWRYDALSQPGMTRATLLASLERGSSGAVRDTGEPVATEPAATDAAASIEPPSAFAVCAACHTVTSDGAPGIGPNLHGVVGRTAGSSPSFAYSPAMKGAGFRWTTEALDEYLTSPAAKVPGNFMMYVGQPDPSERKAIIEYLGSLR